MGEHRRESTRQSSTLKPYSLATVHDVLILIRGFEQELIQKYGLTAVSVAEAPVVVAPTTPEAGIPCA